MGVSEVGEAVCSAMGAIGGKFGELFECTALTEDGVVTVLCTERSAGDDDALPKAMSFTIDLHKYSTFDAVRRVAMDRFCELLLNGPKQTVS